MALARASALAISQRNSPCVPSCTRGKLYRVSFSSLCSVLCSMTSSYNVSSSAFVRIFYLLSSSCHSTFSSFIFLSFVQYIHRIFVLVDSKTKKIDFESPFFHVFWCACVYDFSRTHERFKVASTNTRLPLFFLSSYIFIKFVFLLLFLLLFFFALSQL